MSQIATAVYEKGSLKLLQDIPLKEHQKIQVMVFTPAETQIQQMEEKAKNWLAQQPENAVQKPKKLSSVEKKHLDAEFDTLLSEIHLHSKQFSENEISADVDEAVQAIRAGRQ